MKHHHENDALSVRCLVQELHQEEKNVVIAYKPQGKTDEAFPQLGERSLLLVIMTDFQAPVFKLKSTVLELCVMIQLTKQIPMDSSWLLLLYQMN